MTNVTTHHKEAPVIIARFQMPKQRITRPYEIVIQMTSPGDYAVQRRYTDDLGGKDQTFSGPFEQAWTQFERRVLKDLQRAPAAFESDFLDI